MAPSALTVAAPPVYRRRGPSTYTVQAMLRLNAASRRLQNFQPGAPRGGARRAPDGAAAHPRAARTPPYAYRRLASRPPCAATLPLGRGAVKPAGGVSSSQTAPASPATPVASAPSGQK